MPRFEEPSFDDVPLENKLVINRSHPNPTRSAMSNSGPRTSGGYGAPLPGSVEYYCERYPGFPLYVNEAFSVKVRGGDEALKQYLEEVDKPGIPTTVDVIDDVTKEIVSKKVVVNWF